MFYNIDEFNRSGIGMNHCTYISIFCVTRVLHLNPFIWRQDKSNIMRKIRAHEIELTRGIDDTLPPTSPRCPTIVPPVEWGWRQIILEELQ